MAAFAARQWQSPGNISLNISQLWSFGKQTTSKAIPETKCVGGWGDLGIQDPNLYHMCCP